jgi:hypothetical protein
MIGIGAMGVLLLGQGISVGMAGLPAEAMPAHGEWAEAARRIVRVSPDDLPQLPPAVRKSLNARGCRIPQPDFFFDRIANVISGNFAGNPAPDHAVLCSVDGVSHIHVVWGGPNGCEAEFEAWDDSYALQTVEPHRIGYSRLIEAIDAPDPREIPDQPSEPIGVPEGAQGIEDVFIEKASTRHFCVQGQWREQPGMD